MRIPVVRCSAVLALLAGCGGPATGAGSTVGSSGGPSFGGTGSVGTATATTGPGGFIGPGNVYNQPVVVSKVAPPAISGGTLTMIAQGHKAAVADPERDRITIVDIDQVAVMSTIAFKAGDEPGRSVEDRAGLLHVVLRGAGAVATLDLNAGAERSRQAVCQNPRGIAYDPASDKVHVACVGGELVTMSAAGGEPLRRLQLDSDLRDVVVDGSRLLVSRFRAAELLVVESDGSVSARLKPPSIAQSGNQPSAGPQGPGGGGSFSPAVAWRTIAAPGGGAIMTFQEEQTSDVMAEPGGYGGFCGGIVRSAVALLRADGTGWAMPNRGVLPVDVAVSASGFEVMVASAAASNQAPLSEPIITMVPPTPTQGSSLPPTDQCILGGGSTPDDGTPQPAGQVVAVAYDASGRIVAQTRDPMLVVGHRAVLLPGEPIRDTGHDIFHMGTAGGLACASCHPEGKEDSHVWRFSGLGDRRTQSLNGGTLGTGPFHWNGDMKDITTLAHEVFSARMSGPNLLPEHAQALSGWLDRTPAWKPEIAHDAASADRGKAIFNDGVVGCASCHAGAQMTNHTLVDVGTGGRFKVPSLLGVSFRAPFMHNGCAGKLADRLGDCGGAMHGQITNLADDQRADLIEYLGTL